MVAGLYTDLSPAAINMKYFHTVINIKFVNSIFHLIEIYHKIQNKFLQIFDFSHTVRTTQKKVYSSLLSDWVPCGVKENRKNVCDIMINNLLLNLLR